MRAILSILICLRLCSSFSQDYFQYQKTFNRIDNDVLADNLSSTSKRLDSIYNSYDFIFAKHCIKALQISCVLNDTVNSDKWLRKCFLQGVPIWIIRNNELTQKVFKYKQTNKTVLLYDSLRNIYKSSINVPVANTIDSLLKIDQKKLKK